MVIEKVGEEKSGPRSCGFLLATAGTLELTLSSTASLESLNRGVICSDFHFGRHTLAVGGGDCRSKEADYEAVAANPARGDGGLEVVRSWILSIL